jgi:hypothetical protein
MSKTWTVVVNTAPRKECTCVATLESLEDCGWDPVVFAEPGSSDTGSRMRFDNLARLGIWHNWLKAARWALEQPESDYIMTVQDDTSFHPESKLLVENIDWPADAGYVSLYTPKHYQQWKDGRMRSKGFYPVETKSMWGAMALVFRPSVLREVVNHPRAQSWLGVKPKTKSIVNSVMEARKREPWRIQNSDFIIARIIQHLGRKLYYFNPSPCSHTSKYSSVEHGSNDGKRNAFYVADHSMSLASQIFE